VAPAEQRADLKARIDRSRKAVGRPTVAAPRRTVAQHAATRCAAFAGGAIAFVSFAHCTVCFPSANRSRVRDGSSPSIDESPTEDCRGRRGGAME
jgi:hypothetical protein